MGEARAESTQEAALPRALLERLALYHQIASRLGQEGLDTLASAQLATMLKVDATLVRKDMAAAGISGKPKVGYLIGDVLTRLDELLGLGTRNDAILVGCGRLGSAIAAYTGFAPYGLKIVAVFDNDFSRVGQPVGAHRILPMEKCRSIIEIFRVEFAILTVPPDAAQELANWLVIRGIRAVWNFTPVQLQLPANVVVRHENLDSGLTQLIHSLKRLKTGDAVTVDKSP